MLAQFFEWIGELKYNLYDIRTYQPKIDNVLHAPVSPLWREPMKVHNAQKKKKISRAVAVNHKLFLFAELTM